MKEPKVDFGGLVEQINDLADTMTPSFKLETALEYALEELEKSGNNIAVVRIRRFMKCKKYSTLPSDLKRLIRKGNEHKTSGKFK